MSRSQQKSRPVALRQALQEQNRAAYREAILDAAEQIFLRDGFQSAKMVDIAEATGVSVGTLYNYFDSKDAVFFALAERHRNRYFEAICAPSTAMDAVGRLREFVDRNMAYVESNGAMFAVYMRSSRHILDCVHRTTPALDPEEDHRRFVSIIAGLLNDGQAEGKLRADVPVERLAWVLHALLHSAVLEWVRSSEPNSLIAQGQTLIQLFLEGASTK